MKEKTGAENVQWDLSDLYNSIDDPALENDKKKVVEQAAEFASTYKGNVADLDEEGMNQALQEYE
ncbi:MAG: oligoendopeptidase F, partial [Aliifodinibius sp.]|nr:oligoendopeptidase F [Fodinibius sp.]NIV16284.1 oligoendopeptidase F [Fodinibius sp.]NIY30238.1 oligoendopeptidase F [Fodinibius sp.]